MIIYHSQYLYGSGHDSLYSINVSYCYITSIAHFYNVDCFKVSPCTNCTFDEAVHSLIINSVQFCSMILMAACKTHFGDKLLK